MSQDAPTDPVDGWGIDLAASYAIDNRWHDVEAGRAAGGYAILIERPNSATRADARVGTLREAVDTVVGHAQGART